MPTDEEPVVGAHTWNNIVSDCGKESRSVHFSIKARSRSGGFERLGQPVAHGNESRRLALQAMCVPERLIEAEDGRGSIAWHFRHAIDDRPSFACDFGSYRKGVDDTINTIIE